MNELETNRWNQCFSKLNNCQKTKTKCQWLHAKKTVEWLYHCPLRLSLEQKCLLFCMIHHWIRYNLLLKVASELCDWSHSLSLLANTCRMQQTMRWTKWPSHQNKSSTIPFASSLLQALFVDDGMSSSCVCYWSAALGLANVLALWWCWSSQPVRLCPGMWTHANITEKTIVNGTSARSNNPRWALIDCCYWFFVHTSMHHPYDSNTKTERGGSQCIGRNCVSVDWFDSKRGNLLL